MNATLRHLALRLWITALAGGLGCVIVLPWWQRVFGFGGLLIPVLLLLAICFMLTGWGLDKLGLTQTRRLISEASVWERAGMMAEAESAFQRAIAIFDSFWFSPLQRRRRKSWLTARLARFYISQSSRNAYAHAMVRSYLLNHPADTEVALTWLEQLLNRDHIVAADHEAVARIGNALRRHAQGQQMLMEFHLANGRTDFFALQTYRRVWQTLQPLPESLLIPLVDLLLDAGTLSHWALQIYMDALKRNHQPALAGIAGCACWLRQTVENRENLTAAKKILAQCESEQVADLARRFKPLKPAKPVDRPSRPAVQQSAPRHYAMVEGTTVIAGRTAKALVASFSKIGRVAAKLIVSRYAALGAAMVCVALVVFAIGRQTSKPTAPEPGPDAPVEAAPAVKEPFTIQVAAYLKTEDAQQFVDKLKQHDLDAFWTEATSANRKWYQVKVAHFATKEQARQYGQQLKSKGLIDDYYVANYRLQ